MFWLQTGVVTLLAVGLVVGFFIMRGSGSSDESDESDERTGKKATAAQVHKGDLESALKAADIRIADGRLADSGGDSALDHLLAAKRFSPGAPGVQARLTTIADRYEVLASKAIANKATSEAVKHLRVVLRADPSRESVKVRLESLLGRTAKTGTP